MQERMDFRLKEMKTNQGRLEAKEFLKKICGPVKKNLNHE
jgi:hypothetical protein